MNAEECASWVLILEHEKAPVKTGAFSFQMDSNQSTSNSSSIVPVATL